jgi:hypothetical protein
MSRRQTVLAATLLACTFVSGVVVGQTERFELEGNLKFFGVGNGIIFSDGSKQTSAGVGSANDIICADCVDASDIATSGVGSAEVLDNSLLAGDLAADSVGTSEIATDGVGAAEIAAGAVGTSEVADNTLTASDLAADSVGTSEIATDGVGASEIAAGAVGSSEVAAKSLTLSNVSMTVTQNYTLDLFTTLSNGSCSSFSAQGGLTNVAAGSFALIYDVRLASNAANPGWVVESEASPTGAANSIKVRICNYTGGSADPPNLRFSFWTIAP